MSESERVDDQLLDSHAPVPYIPPVWEQLEAEQYPRCRHGMPVVYNCPWCKSEGVRGVGDE